MGTDPRQPSGPRTPPPARPPGQAGPARGGADVEPELHIAPPETYEAGGATPTRSNKELPARSRTPGGARTTHGPTLDAVGGLDMALKGHDAPPIPIDDGPSAPCPECGWPLPLSARLCTRCGFSRDQGRAVSTELGEEAAPQPRPDTRFQTWEATEKSLSGVRWRRASLWLGVSLLIIVGTKAGLNGPGEAAAYLGRYATALGVLVVFYAAASLFWLDRTRAWPLAIAGLAASLAGSQLAQHLINIALPILPWLGWMLALFVFIGLFADMLDAEIIDAVIFGVIFLAARLGLHFGLMAMTSGG